MFKMAVSAQNQMHITNRRKSNGLSLLEAQGNLIQKEAPKEGSKKLCLNLNVF